MTVMPTRDEKKGTLSTIGGLAPASSVLAPVDPWAGLTENRSSPFCQWLFVAAPLPKVALCNFARHFCPHPIRPGPNHHPF